MPTDDANVDTGLMIVPVFSRERSLGPFVDADLVLQRRELLPELRLNGFLHNDTGALGGFKVLARGQET